MTTTFAPEVSSPLAPGISRDEHHQILIVGGGTAGISVAARLCKGRGPKLDVAVVEPSDKHYYQPLWTLVGAGAARRERTVRSEASVMPRRAHWIRESVAEFRPLEQQVVTDQGRRLHYDYLVVAAGIQLNWGAIPGLRESLGQGGVCSNYSFQHVNYTWELLRTFQGGNAVFTHPSGAVKCGGAPQKICYLADDCFRRRGVRDRCRLVFATAMPNIFAVPKYARTLERVIERKQIETRFLHNLVEIRPSERVAVFERLDTGERVSMEYDLLHVTPPMSAPAFIARSPLADSDGWVDVDKHTLRHARFPNVFALGDCSSLPTSKTGAAIRKQAPVVARNLRSLLRGEPTTARYDGYTSCPLVTGYGKLVLAEFDYDKNPQETFPFDQSKERWSMYVLKKVGLPLIYWNGMLKGRL
ncbi:MAG: NAD(P)/FAD-dependent oxidoreductase [Pirellulaceae bacterium]|nr:NAD(P)/FAD-dependent oxidoreductase [Pirellulaceae bacterium]